MSSSPSEARGDVNDLRTLLRDQGIARDPQRKREVLRRVIALMTMGVDTSALFTDMIMACITKDLVHKKMIYFYLCVHSEANSELAILAINTLQKDCRDESPLVRGLALRSLASLRLPQLVEYLVPVLKQAMLDSSPYVRKTANVSTLKLYRIAPEEFNAMKLTEKMYGMLRDTDPMVAMNALAVLDEVTRDQGGMQINKSILYFLLNRLREVPEWQQTQILNLVLKYTPANEEEMFDIMNLMEEHLQGNNSAVILACCHIFLHLTQNLPAVHKQVFSRIKLPLLTLMTASVNNETSYAVLCHIKLLAQREPTVFQSHYKDFYCRFSDPTYIKAAKLEMLAMLATESNAEGIVSEFAAYAEESNASMSRLSIECLGKVALRIESVAQPVLNHFLEFMTVESDVIRGHTLVVMKDFLRKYRRIEVVRPFLETLVKTYNEMNFADEESKIALVWVLGELGEHIEDAPYILEGLCDGLLYEPPGFRLQMLTTAVMLFFKRPPEMQSVLATVFQTLINDFSHADVHDRALLYYRLLRQNVHAASQIICAPKAEVQDFVEDQNADLKDKLFEEFDTLSVIFNVPSNVFVHKRGVLDDEDEDSDEEDESGSDDDGDVNGDGAHAGGSSNGHAHRVELSEEADLEPPQFQRLWSSITDAAVIPLQFKTSPNSEAFSETLEDYNIMTLASGSQGTTEKFYLYAQEEGEMSQYFLAELLLHVNGTVNVTVKADNPKRAAFVQLLQKVLSAYC